MTTPLVPQLRADKNGKLVTRHMVDVGASTPLSSTLPAPSLTVGQQAPDKTEKEMHKEMCEELALRLFGVADDDPKSPYSHAVGALSWIKTPLLENINDALDNPPKYRTIISNRNNLSHHLNNDKGFAVALAASVHDIGTALSNAGFEDFRSPESFCDEYFHRPTIKYVKDTNIEEFRVVYLANALELDEDRHPDGKMAYYRELGQLAEKLDDVIKALPVLHTIIKDSDNLMIDDGIMDILMISEHVSTHSDAEKERICAYIESRDEMHVYDPELVDEMLAVTTPAMTTGWL